MKRDFFISYNRVDLAWAEWIAWQLEAEGLSVMLEAWDYRPGGSFLTEKNKAAKKANQTIVLLSHNYLLALYKQPKWVAALAQTPEEGQKPIVAMRVRECKLTGPLTQMSVVDLLDLNETDALNKLLNALDVTTVKQSSEGLLAEQGVSFTGSLPPEYPNIHAERPKPAVRSEPGLIDKLTDTNTKKLGLLAVVIVLLIIVFSPKHSGMGQYESQGERYLNTGRYTQAKQSFQAALKTNPKDEDALWGLKKVELWESMEEEGFKQNIQTLYDEHPNDAHINLFYGLFYAQNHESEKAIQHYTRALELDPDLAEAYYYLGKEHEQQGKIQDAERDYKEALELRVASKYRNNLAHLYAKQKNYISAISEYGKNAQFPLSALELAKIYWLQDNLSQSIDNQQHALTWLNDDDIMKEPENREPWHFDVGKRGVDLVKINEKKSYAYFCLAASHFMLGHIREAEDAIQKMRDLNIALGPVNDVLRADLDRLVQENKHYAVQVSAFKRKYLL